MSLNFITTKHDEKSEEMKVCHDIYSLKLAYKLIKLGQTLYIYIKFIINKIF